MLFSLIYLLKQAEEEKYAVPAFNIHNLEFLHAVVETCEEKNSPCILQISPKSLNYMEQRFAKFVVNYAKSSKIPVSVHLDHGKDLYTIRKALHLGFSSVMFDGSKLPFEDNIRLTKKAKRLSSSFSSSCEGELGIVGSKGEISEKFTSPEEAEIFVKKTGVDALAVAIGNSHGIYKTKNPKLNINLLKKIRKRVDLPLVLHGASGLSKEEIRKAIKEGISKINFATDLMLSFKEGIKKKINETNDIRKIFSEAKEELKKEVERKILICNSLNKL